MMKKWQLFIPILVLFYGCMSVDNQKLSYKTQNVDYGSFTIELPLNWKPLTVEYEDSAIGNIQIDSITFIGFDIGQYSNNLDEDDFEDYYEIMDGKVYLIDKSSSRNNRKLNYFGKTDNVTLEKVRKSNVKWVTIDGYKTKLLTAKKPGVGLTGIYIDSLRLENGTKIKFVMSGKGLSSQQQDQFLTAIKTLKFYNKPTVLKLPGSVKD
jgi:hypothetical protein